MGSSEKKDPTGAVGDPQPIGEAVDEAARGPEEQSGEWERLLREAPEGDEFDLLGRLVADMLRTARDRADETRRRADEYAEGARARADEDATRVLETANNELAAAERARRRAESSLQMAETRFVDADRALSSAREKADELLASARAERSTIVAEAAREGEQLLAGATELFQRRLLDVREQQQAASALLSEALSSLESLGGDLDVLQPGAVLDLTAPDAKVDTEPRAEPEIAPPPESVMARTLPSSLQAERDPAETAEVEPAEDPRPDPETSAIAGTDEGANGQGEGGGRDTAARPETAEPQESWLNSVVQSAVHRAVNQSDPPPASGDDPET